MGTIRAAADAAQRRSVSARTALLVAAAARRAWRNRRGHDGNPGGVRHGGKLTMDESIAYVERQFAGYVDEVRRRYPDYSFQGKRVLEVGPGDSDAVAVLFAAAGASEVVAIDRFRPQRDEVLNEALCAAVLERFDPARLGLGPTPSIDLATARARVVYLHGVPMETAQPDTLGTFDLIVSNAVLEHVYDLRASLAAMRRLLASGGVIAHNVDLTEHGLYGKHDHHPLTHLTVPERTYRFIVRPSGAPNRALAPEYRGNLDELGFDAQVRVTRQLFRNPDAGGDMATVREEPMGPQLSVIRSALRPEFDGYSDEDLNAASIFIVGHARA